MATGFKTATVNASSVPATQTNFPSYVDLSRLGITTLAEAQSVRVYADSSKTTEWAREIVSVTEMHVKIPSLTSTTSIYVDWDGVRADYAVTDPYGRNAVWSDYLGVYHFEGNSNDSTSNGKNGTDTNASYSTSYGYIEGQGVSLTGSGGSQISTSLIPADRTALSISSWAYYNSASNPTGAKNIWATWNFPSIGADHNCYFGPSSGTNWRMGDAQNITYTLAKQTWFHWAWTNDGGEPKKAYFNGAYDETTVNSGGNDQPDHDNLHIGAQGNGGENWIGYLDEFRVRQSELSANWITTEYNNQSDEATFWGSWSNVGGVTVASFLTMMGVGS